MKVPESEKHPSPSTSYPCHLSNCLITERHYPEDRNHSHISEEECNN